MPNCPLQLLPQQRSPPSARRTHVAASPVLTPTAVVAASTPVIPETGTGTELLMVVPLPNWPLEFSPQQRAVPSAITAHELDAPVLTLTAVVAAVAPEMADTNTGTFLSMVVPSPTVPWELKPQQRTVPSAIRAHACPPIMLEPRLRLTAVVAGVAPVIPDTCTGTLLFVVVPLPNSPRALFPQHLTDPSNMSAQAEALLTLTLTAVVAIDVPKPDTDTGTLLLEVMPLPN